MLGEGSESCSDLGIAAVGNGKYTNPGVQDQAPTASLSHNSLTCKMNVMRIKGDWVSECTYHIARCIAGAW